MQIKIYQCSFANIFWKLFITIRCIQLLSPQSTLLTILNPPYWAVVDKTLPCSQDTPCKTLSLYQYYLDLILGFVLSLIYNSKRKQFNSFSQNIVPLFWKNYTFFYHSYISPLFVMWYWMRFYSKPGTSLNGFQVRTFIILIRIPWWHCYYYYCQFADEETKSEGSWVTCPKSDRDSNLHIWLQWLYY